ncbi:hypothetical protein THASP1DRAFT_3220, partial [Thamnocephalis sphaerospora]
MAKNGTSNVLLKLKASVEEGKYYEAHQMYRSVCNRYVKAKNYDKAVRLLASGARVLLDHEQYGSGVDLALYLVEVYASAEFPVDKKRLGLIVELIDRIPTNVQSRKQLIAASILWTAKASGTPSGNAELHDHVGALYWKEGDFAEAERHFFLGTTEGAAAWGEMLYE